MATTPQPFLAQAPATRIARVSDTTLFHLAARYYGDARWWTIIAKANGLTDPWVASGDINVPFTTLPAQTPTGLLGL